MQEVELREEGEGEFYVTIYDGATGRVNIDVETRGNGEDLIDALLVFGMVVSERK